MAIADSVVLKSGLFYFFELTTVKTTGSRSARSSGFVINLISTKEGISFLEPIFSRPVSQFPKSVKNDNLVEIDLDMPEHSLGLVISVDKNDYSFGWYGNMRGIHMYYGKGLEKMKLLFIFFSWNSLKRYYSDAVRVEYNSISISPLVKKFLLVWLSFTFEFSKLTPTISYKLLKTSYLGGKYSNCTKRKIWKEINKLRCFIYSYHNGHWTWTQLPCRFCQYNSKSTLGTENTQCCFCRTGSFPAADFLYSARFYSQVGHCGHEF